MDSYMRRFAVLVRWLVDAAPSERAFLEWFFTFIYTPRAHNDGTVDQIIEEVLAFPHKQAPENTSVPSTPSSTTTRATAWRRSPSRRSCSPAGSI
jgi:hypothetical protein